MVELLFNFTDRNALGVALAVVPMLINIGILVYTYAALPRDRLTNAFGFFLVALIGWQLFDTMVRLSGNAETAQAWRGLFRISQFVVVPLGLWFSLLYTDRERTAEHPLVLAILFLPGILMASSYQGGIATETLVNTPNWGFVAHHQQGPVHQTNIIWNGVLSLVMLGILFQHLWVIRQNPDRAPGVRLVAIGFAIPTLLGVVLEVGFPIVLDIQQIPVTSTNMVFFSLLTAYALGRHGLFRVSTPTAARAVIETITDPLVIAAPDGKILFANPVAALRFGIDRDALHRHTAEQLIAPEDVQHFQRAIFAPATRGHALAGVEARLQDKSGNQLAAIISAAPVPISRNGAPGVALLLHDVSALKRTEEALLEAKEAAEAANRTKSLFLANMSHELRTPLNAIIGYAELLAEDFELDGRDDVTQDLRRIEGSGRYLLKLINDILDLSKVESGKMEVRVEAADVADIADEVAVTGRSLCDKQRNTLVLDLDPVPPVLADRLRLRQVLLNLVSNAAKFTEDGTVTLSSRTLNDARGQWVLLSVTDTGIGMSEAQQKGLFQLFSQVHTSEHEKFGGTGLGLALSRRLCQVMGGDIDVRSEQGRGTTFTVRLPATTHAPQSTSPAHQANLAFTPSGGALTSSLDQSLDSGERVAVATLSTADHSVDSSAAQSVDSSFDQSATADD